MAKLDKISSVIKTTRSAEWWEFKIATILGTAYATAIILKISFDDLPLFLVFLLLALVPGAVFVSLINDFTDLEVDKLAGKQNRLEGKSKLLSLLAIFACLIFGIIICFFLQTQSLLIYLCAWISYTLYSFPPIRLKERGFAGVLADALGANVFPQLFTISLLSDWFGKEPDLIWFFAVAVWSLFWGLRGILRHQLIDKANDEISQVNTFVQRHNISFVKKLGVRIFFPIEMCAFSFMLIYSRVYLALIFLILYFLIEWLRYLLWYLELVILSSVKDHRIFMLEYYSIFYPLGFLIAGLNFSFTSIIILIFHLIIFFRGFKELIVEGKQLLREFIFGY